ncbi:MAG: S-layer homology domain-containing protein [Candidatus Gastranaerophilales bacterium]|nr:S-layer homology domain-containing protein [Candidatus Gastranaerophilales bacterium]
MKNKITKFLITTMILNVTTAGAFAKTFSDLGQSHWAYKEIQKLADDKVVVGYPDGSFKPDNPATRAEFSTMVIKALRQENSLLLESFTFYDVQTDYWAYNTIERAVAFGLIKGFPDGTFKPEDNISKAEAVAIIISALKTGDLSIIKAKEALKNYVDADTIPDWVIVPAGKSELLRMTAHVPETYNLFQPDKKATRAEIAVNLLRMREEAKHNPNDILAEAMRLKTGEGIVLENATVEDIYGTIPAGTLIPVQLVTPLTSQKTDIGEVFIVKANKNLVTKDKYLLIRAGSNISGIVVSVKPGRYFVRNAKMALDTKSIKTPVNQKTDFPGNINTKQGYKNFFDKIVRLVFKGGKINLPADKDLYVKLNKAIKVDLTNGIILK